MKKNTTANEAVHTDGVINPKLVFSDDALVVDYLNSLLASAPSMSLDSGEIHFVHLAIGTDWESPGTANSAVDTPMVFDSKLLNIDAEELRKENEHFKFRTELAEIDSQVLRGENDNLKVEIARLTIQLTEMKKSLDAMADQNSTLQLWIDQHLNQLTTLSAGMTESSPHSPEQSERTVDDIADATRELVSEPAVPLDSTDAVTDQSVEPELAPEIQQDSVPSDTIQDFSPLPEIVVQDVSSDKKTGHTIDPDTAIISQSHVEVDRTSQGTGHNVVVFSNTRVAAGTSVQSVRPVSKVIKQHQTVKHYSHQESDQALKNHSRDHVQQADIHALAEKKPDVVQQHDDVTEQKQMDEPFSKLDTLHLDDVEDIKLEPVPDPKVVVRKNVKNYEDLQKEADPAHTTIAGHTVVL